MKEGCLWERGECLRFSAKLDRWLIVPLLGLACLAGGSTDAGSAMVPDGGTLGSWWDIDFVGNDPTCNTA